MGTTVCNHDQFRVLPQAYKCVPKDHSQMVKVRNINSLCSPSPGSMHMTGRRDHSVSTCVSFAKWSNKSTFYFRKLPFWPLNNCLKETVKDQSTSKWKELQTSWTFQCPWSAAFLHPHHYDNTISASREGCVCSLRAVYPSSSTTHAQCITAAFRQSSVYTLSRKMRAFMKKIAHLTASTGHLNS